MRSNYSFNADEAEELRKLGNGECSKCGGDLVLLDVKCNMVDVNVPLQKDDLTDRNFVIFECVNCARDYAALIGLDIIPGDKIFKQIELMRTQR
jgi:hypothetical protein